MHLQHALHDLWHMYANFSYKSIYLGAKCKYSHDQKRCNSSKIATVAGAISNFLGMTTPMDMSYLPRAYLPSSRGLTGSLSAITFGSKSVGSSLSTFVLMVC